MTSRTRLIGLAAILSFVVAAVLLIMSGHRWGSYRRVTKTGVKTVTITNDEARQFYDRQLAVWWKVGGGEDAFKICESILHDYGLVITCHLYDGLPAAQLIADLRSLRDKLAAAQFVASPRTLVRRQEYVLLNGRDVSLPWGISVASSRPRLGTFPRATAVGPLGDHPVPIVLVPSPAPTIPASSAPMNRAWRATVRSAGSPAAGFLSFSPFAATTLVELDRRRSERAVATLPSADPLLSRAPFSSLAAPPLLSEIIRAVETSEIAKWLWLRTVLTASGRAEPERVLAVGVGDGASRGELDEDGSPFSLSLEVETDGGGHDLIADALCARPRPRDPDIREAYLCIPVSDVRRGMTGLLDHGGWLLILRGKAWQPFSENLLVAGHPTPCATGTDGEARWVLLMADASDRSLGSMLRWITGGAAEATGNR